MNSQAPPFSVGASRWQWNERQEPSGSQIPADGLLPDSWPASNDEQRWTAFTDPRGISHQVHHREFPPMAAPPTIAPPFVPLRGPFSANVLRSEEPEISSSVPTEPSGGKKKARRRGQVHHRINPSDWDKCRGYLKKLYIEEQKTVPSIMEHMKRDFNFNASEQQYKNKFSEWGFSKNLPKHILPPEVTQWIMSKKEEREQAGKKTEFLYENRMVPITRIQETARRGKFPTSIAPFEHPTPIGLTYSTPAIFDKAPSPFQTGIFSPHPPDQTRLNGLLNMQAVQPSKIRLTWKGYNRADFENQIAHGRSLSDLGMIEEAEHTYLEALSGFQNLLSATNERTVSVAYELAELYAKQSRMRDADEVLEWVSDNIVKTWGLEHKKSIAHMLHIIDLYHAWSRPDDALTLLHRAVEYLEDPPITAAHRFQAANDDTLPKGQTFTTRLIDLSNNTGQAGRPSSMELELVVAKAQARAADEEAEPILLGMIKQCEGFPEQFDVQNFKAHSSLLELYHNLGVPDKLLPALRNARNCFATIMKKRRKGMKLSDSFSNAAVDLLGHFIRARRVNAAEAMFELLREATTISLDANRLDNMIDLLVASGNSYQRHGMWRYARPRFEHALAITLASRGPQSMMSKRLEAALANKSFSTASMSTATLIT